MGFKVVRDFIKEKDEQGAVGIESAKPSNFWQTHIGMDPDSDAYEYNGGQIKIRLRDDDGNVYYHCLVDDAAFSCELALDWGGRYAGTVDLDLHMKDYHALYGEPKNAQFLSKDGKWYSYMG